MICPLQVYFKATDPFNERWQTAWTITAFWDVIAFVLLCIICYLWTPSQNSQRYVTPTYWFWYLSSIAYQQEAWFCELRVTEIKTVPAISMLSWSYGSLSYMLVIQFIVPSEMDANVNVMVWTDMRIREKWMKKTKKFSLWQGEIKMVILA